MQDLMLQYTDTKPDGDQKEEKIQVLDAGDIQLLKTYGQGPYASQLKRIEKEIEDIRKRVNEKMGVKESETGLAPPNLVRFDPLQIDPDTRKLTCISVQNSGTSRQTSSGWEKSTLCKLQDVPRSFPVASRWQLQPLLLPKLAVRRQTVRRRTVQPTDHPLQISHLHSLQLEQEEDKVEWVDWGDSLVLSVAEVEATGGRMQTRRTSMSSTSSRLQSLSLG